MLRAILGTLEMRKMMMMENKTKACLEKEYIQSILNLTIFLGGKEIIVKLRTIVKWSNTSMRCFSTS